MNDKKRRDKNTEEDRVTIEVSSSWAQFIKYCEKLQFGSIGNVEIKNGQPVTAEKIEKNVQFL